MFELLKTDIKYSNLSKEEWNAIRYLADDRNIILEKAEKGSLIVIWGKNNYVMKAQKQPSDETVY